MARRIEKEIMLLSETDFCHALNLAEKAGYYVKVYDGSAESGPCEPYITDIVRPEVAARFAGECPWCGLALDPRNGRCPRCTMKREEAQAMLDEQNADERTAQGELIADEVAAALEEEQGQDDTPDPDRDAAYARYLASPMDPRD